MRLHRLTLRSYRGVASCELTFAEHGVTVVEGDNEAGKSSAAEALHLLLEYRDDSSHRRVMAVKPLHHDEGAEVEAELSAGALRLTYRKRWHRDRTTQLRITSPRPEVLTGRAAHDRVRELLGQTVDLELWKALSAPQGNALEQPGLRDHPSLVAALDEAAGGALGTAGESELLKRAVAEAGRWSTPLGRPKAPLLDLRRRAGDAATSLEEHEAAIEALDADVTWCADLERRTAELEPKLRAATVAASDAATAAAELGVRHAAVEGLAVRARLAVSEAALADGDLGGRAALVAGAEAAETAAHEAGAAMADAVSAVEVTARALAEAKSEAVSAAEAAETSGAAVAAAEAAHVELRQAATAAQLATQVAELESMLATAVRLQADVTRDERALAANPSSPRALVALQAAHDEALKAEAAAAAARPSVHLEARNDLDVRVDGAHHGLEARSSTHHVVADCLVVDVPGQLRITVTAGAAAGVLDARHLAARRVLQEQCDLLGVRDLEATRALEDERRSLVAALSGGRAALAAALGGREVAQLVTLADEARAVLAGGGMGAPDRAPTVEALDEAHSRWDVACRQSRLASRAADRRADQATTARQDARAAVRGQEQARAELATAHGALAGLRTELGAARAASSDAALLAAAESAAAHARAAGEAWSTAAAGVNGDELQRAVTSAQRTAAERDGLARSFAELREDLAGIRSRLELQGEGGLHDRLAEARRRATAVTAELCSVEQRAAAASLLLATLIRHRDEAARAYGAPLGAELERLGTLVFGRGFTVELDDELRITRRVLNGDPVPWSELSVGAREQLGVLTRLAVATIVSPDGGVPVVFDDVLGFTDPGRLALMAAAFEAAAERCQIIVLTCDPARYRHLARATTICLAGPREVGARQAG